MIPERIPLRSTALELLLSHGPSGVFDECDDALAWASAAGGFFRLRGGIVNLRIEMTPSNMQFNAMLVLTR